MDIMKQYDLEYLAPHRGIVKRREGERVTMMREMLKREDVKVYLSLSLSPYIYISRYIYIDIYYIISNHLLLIYAIISSSHCRVLV